MTSRTRVAPHGPISHLRQWARSCHPTSVASSATGTHHPPTSDQRCAIRSSSRSMLSPASAGSAKTWRSRRRCSAWCNRSGVDATSGNPITISSHAEGYTAFLTSQRHLGSVCSSISYRQSSGRLDHNSQRAIAARRRSGARSGRSAVKVIAPTNQPNHKSPARNTRSPAVRYCVVHQLSAVKLTSAAKLPSATLATALTGPWCAVTHCWSGLYRPAPASRANAPTLSTMSSISSRMKTLA
jgi:hypothetical protein